MSGDAWGGVVFIYFVVTIFAMAMIMPEFDNTSNEKGVFVAIALWPITLLVLSPVLLVKLGAVVFKRRGLLSSWLTVITSTYKGAVK